MSACTSMLLFSIKTFEVAPRSFKEFRKNETWPFNIVGFGLSNRDAPGSPSECPFFMAKTKENRHGRVSVCP